jgi:hypothetical protein
VNSALRALGGTRRHGSDGAPRALAAFQSALDWCTSKVIQSGDWTPPLTHSWTREDPDDGSRNEDHAAPAP